MVLENKGSSSIKNVKYYVFDLILTVKYFSTPGAITIIFFCVFCNKYVINIRVNSSKSNTINRVNLSDPLDLEEYLVMKWE